MTESVLEQLTQLVGAENILTGDQIGMDYAHDEYPAEKEYFPEAVCIAHSTAAVAEIVKYCNENGIALTPRGAGTGQAGGSVPVSGGIVLSLKEMNQILSLDEENRRMTVEAGVLLQDVKAEAEAHGLYYPPDPGEKTATIGGNVSTNAAGPCAGKYGRTENYVLDAVFVTGEGRIVRISELPDGKAVIGAEGTVGILTEITLKLIEKPAADVILLFPFADAETCISAAKKIQTAGYDAAIMEYLDTDIVAYSGNITGNPVFPVEMDGDRVDSTLVVSMEGDGEEDLEKAMENIAELAEELECLDILVVDTPNMKRDLWAAYDAFHTSVETAKAHMEYNIDLPSDRVPEMVAFAKAVAGEKGISVMAYAHLMSGNVHLHAVADISRADFSEIEPMLASAVYGKCVELGGSITGEYGIGYAKMQYLSGTDIIARKAKKASFDPSGILNPGKLF